MENWKIENAEEGRGAVGTGVWRVYYMVKFHFKFPSWSLYRAKQLFRDSVNTTRWENMPTEFGGGWQISLRVSSPLTASSVNDFYDL